jgi:linoleoyl-CoA desaturase
VNGWDTDIEQSDIFRVFPNGGYSKYHKYQHIYMPFLYPLFLFNWLVVRDFKDFFNKKKTVRKGATCREERVTWQARAFPPMQQRT